SGWAFDGAHLVGAIECPMSTLTQTPADTTAPAAFSGFDQQFIAGSWRRGRSEKVNKDRNPYTREVLIEIQQASDRDLDEAYRAAAQAQRAWGAALPGERVEVMRRAARVMRRRREEIIEW